jgi:hypothetical protein
MAGAVAPTVLDGTNWLALLLEPPTRAVTPGSAPRQAAVAGHQEFGRAAGARVKGGSGLDPPATAKTVRVRDCRRVLRVVAAEGLGRCRSPTDRSLRQVANGFYVLSAADRDEAVTIASMIPATTVELRQLARGVGAIAIAE